MLRVLLLHNRYQIAGGEDEVVRQESALLRADGNEVEVFLADNDRITSTRKRIRAAVNTFYSKPMFSEVSKTILRFRPDVVHVHNFVPQLSPAVYDAAHKHGCSVVQTLHNYRLLCANAQLFRDGRPCRDCLGRSFGWPGVLHRCYRGSALGSGVIAGMNSWHRARGTWHNRVDKYIVLTEFARNLFVESGMIPPDRIIVKPNTVADLGVGAEDGNYLLYAGRLSPEKGVRVLLQAAQQGDGFGIPLKIAGSGPLEGEVRSAERNGKIEFLGNQNNSAVRQLMQRASALIFPSLWYEGLPMVIAEAFSAGLPVIASRLGAMKELITHESNGLLVEAGSVEALQAATTRLLSSPALMANLRRNARATYEANYTPEVNLRTLYRAYEDAQSAFQFARTLQDAPELLT